MSDYKSYSDMQEQYNSKNTIQTNERISWKNYFKEICITTAKRSCCNKLHVGCILVKDNRIISCGYNGFLPGYPHNSIIKKGHEVATIHAEQNTIADCVNPYKYIPLFVSFSLSSYANEKKLLNIP